MLAPVFKLSFLCEFAMRKKVSKMSFVSLVYFFHWKLVPTSGMSVKTHAHTHMAYLCTYYIDHLLLNSLSHTHKHTHTHFALPLSHFTCTFLFLRQSAVHVQYCHCLSLSLIHILTYTLAHSHTLKYSVDPFFKLYHSPCTPCNTSS